MMSINNLITIYNETFQYIDDKYGRKSLLNLWTKMSEEWCVDLDNYTKNKGLKGISEYWCGESGTLNLEKASYSFELKDDGFFATMSKCPSLVDELINKNRVVFKDYCKHCIHLYGPIIEKYGFSIDWFVEYNIKTEKPIGRCRWEIKKMI